MEIDLQVGEHVVHELRVHPACLRHVVNNELVGHLELEFAALVVERKQAEVHFAAGLQERLDDQHDYAVAGDNYASHVRCRDHTVLALAVGQLEARRPDIAGGHEDRLGQCPARTSVRVPTPIRVVPHE